ncbi:uncharacterized protein EV154DRAFT_530435 [Mucor mucedo]|uniref:uncharacterized protein n=1 Tax=Mucor mucedo TaxID=29922 RepID=UPI0022205898|nr:uncharacterized protein EV154DRAFT_530435 [Mucor mucedo]KAI7869840.1 hypothetical protein EV154DRAFT_530435 [Mucor mucedo]
MANKDVKYIELITAILQNIVSEENRVNWDEFLIQAKDLIVSSYTGGNLNTFKGVWKRKFQIALDNLDYKLRKDSGNRNVWQSISGELKMIRDSPSVYSAITPSSSKSSEKSSSINSKHNTLVSTETKARLIEKISQLNDHSKWRLSSGKFVEDAVCLVIDKCQYEHPAFSFIVDTSDLIWKKVFTKEELREIKNYKAPVLPSIDEDVKNYLTSFDQDVFKKAKDFYDHAFESKFEFGTSKTKRWIQKSVIEVAEVFEDDERIELSDFSEGDLSNKIWQFVFKCFKESHVDAKLGERVSTASSLGRNESRGLEGLGRRERKVTGVKVDILFKAGRHEVGCCEVGKEDVLPIDDKYLDDGMMKLPKTLRDMLSRLVNANPIKVNSLYTVGFLMMGLDLELLIMDIPSGNTITRISRTKKLPFPDQASNIGIDLTALLETVLIGRKLMEDVEALISCSRKRKPVELNNDDSEDEAAAPFLSHSFNIK